MRPVRPEDHTERRYEVRHTTTYTYTDDVTASYGRACLRPRDTGSQTVVTNEIHIDPPPGILTEHLDLFGNWSHYLEVLIPHRELVVAKTSVVDVCAPMPDLAEPDRWTVDAAVRSVAARGDDPSLRAAYLLPSELVGSSPEVTAYAQRFLPARAPLGRALADLVAGIHEDFRYAKGSTTVHTTLPELIEIRAGVCQDFAHLAIGALRAVGLPARYVSGYLETAPPPGRPKLRGSDATHAWASVQLPDGTWLDLDPTNDCVTDSRHVTTAWGRDYRDVAPFKGVIFTEGTTARLDVAVDVVRLPEPTTPRTQET